VVALGIATRWCSPRSTRTWCSSSRRRQVASHEAPLGRTFRIGGMVVPGSVKREGVEVRFVVTDTAQHPGGVSRAAAGSLPRRLRASLRRAARPGRRLSAREVLAKHDENYMPPKPSMPSTAPRSSARRRRCRHHDPGARSIRAGARARRGAAAGRHAIAGAARRNASWIALARPAARTQALLVAFAFGCLTYSFVANDFSVLYVVEHSNSALPLHYRSPVSWGGHEGSLLLWTLMLACG